MITAEQGLTLCLDVPGTLDVCTECAYTIRRVGFEWDEKSKAGINYQKHGVRMPEAVPVFDDPYAITIADDESDPGEQRFITNWYGSVGPAARGGVHVARREYSDRLRARGRGARA